MCTSDSPDVEPMEPPQMQPLPEEPEPVKLGNDDDEDQPSESLLRRLQIPLAKPQAGLGA
jgi:hypothetical protein